MQEGRITRCDDAGRDFQRRILSQCPVLMVAQLVKTTVYAFIAVWVTNWGNHPTQPRKGNFGLILQPTWSLTVLNISKLEIITI